MMPEGEFAMKTDPDCIFCKIVAGDIPVCKILEDDAAIDRKSVV